MTDTIIETSRLILRRWREADAAPFHAMGQDAEVMRYLGPPMTIEDAHATVARVNAGIDRDGCGFWAIERREDREFLGFCGVKPGPAGTPIADDLEIGWRLRRDAWGQSYAREAAEAALAWAWANTSAPRVTAITVPANAASRGLMVRLGMRRIEDGDFDHPALAAGDPLRRHVLYEILRA